MIRPRRVLVAVALAALAGACRPDVRNPNRFCQRDDECDANERCLASRCAARTPSGCDACGGATPFCNVDHCECTGVRDSDTCKGDGRVCIDGACVACTDSTRCPDDTCCSRATGRCVAARWDRVSASGTPPGARYQHAAVLDADNDRMLVFGGRADPNTELDDLWELRLGQSPVWSRLPLVGAPTKRAVVAAAVDPPRRRALFVEGHLPSDADNPFAVLALSKLPVWSTPTVEPGPERRAAPTLTWDPKRGRFLLFGGYTKAGSDATNDVWSLAPEPFAWTNLLPRSMDPPLPRGQASAVYDAVSDELVIFGGQNSPTYNDIWALSLGQGPPAWREVKPTNAPPISVNGASMILEPSMRRLVVFGGLHYEQDVVFDNAVTTLALTSPGTRPMWTPLKPQGTPPPGRDRHSAVWDPKREQMIVFGGKTKTPLDDTWALTLPACM